MNENTFFMIMFGFGALMALATIAYVIRQAFSRQGGEIGGWELRGAGQRIAAVTRTTLAEGLRAKVASGFALLILVSIPLFWLTADGDGTIKGRVQMFITYSLGFAGFILAILTILFGCRSLSVEIARKQIYGIVTKPIPRWQIVAGKWLGVMVLNVTLLGLAGLLTYLGTQATVARFKAGLEEELQSYGRLAPQEAEAAVASLERVRGVGAQGMESPIIDALADAIGKTRKEVGDMLLRLPEPSRVNLRRFDELRRQVLVARAALPVTLPDFSESVADVYGRLKEEDRLPEGWSEARVRQQILADLGGRYCSIGPGNVRQWDLHGPAPEKGRDWVMSVRFKIRVGRMPLAETFEGRTLEENTMLLMWGLGDPRKSNFLETVEAYPINTSYEVEIPQEGVEQDGRLLVSVMNVDPREIEAIFDIPNGDLVVLYRVGPFELSLAQAGLAILIPLACLAAIAVCASTFLSFPVGTLIVLTLYIISSSMGFVAESLAVTDEYAPPEHVRTATYQLRRVTVQALGWALSIGDLDPVGHLLEGRAVGWPALFEKGCKHVLVKGLAVLLVAVLVLRRRELAAVVV